MCILKYRRETEFKAYPQLIILWIAMFAYDGADDLILETMCVILCLFCIGLDRMLQMRLQRQPKELFYDLNNLVETFTDVYLRTAPIMLLMVALPSVRILLPCITYVFEVIAASAILLEQEGKVDENGKNNLTTAKLRKTAVMPLYYALFGSIACYNFSVYLKHAVLNHKSVLHIKSLVIEEFFRALMAIMYFDMALHLKKNEGSGWLTTFRNIYCGLGRYKNR
eukprot:UN02794